MLSNHQYYNCLIQYLDCLFPVLVLFIKSNYIVTEGSSYLIYSIILAVIVAFNHRSNIKRLLTGTENKISFKK